MMDHSSANYLSVGRHDNLNVIIIRGIDSVTSTLMMIDHAWL